MTSITPSEHNPYLKQVSSADKQNELNNQQSINNQLKKVINGLPNNDISVKLKSIMIGNVTAGKNILDGLNESERIVFISMLVSKALNKTSSAEDVWFLESVMKQNNVSDLGDLLRIMYGPLVNNFYVLNFSGDEKEKQEAKQFLLNTGVKQTFENPYDILLFPMQLFLKNPVREGKVIYTNNKENIKNLYEILSGNVNQKEEPQAEKQQAEKELALVSAYIKANRGLKITDDEKKALSAYGYDLSQGFELLRPLMERYLKGEKAVNKYADGQIILANRENIQLLYEILLAKNKPIEKLEKEEDEFEKQMLKSNLWLRQYINSLAAKRFSLEKMSVGVLTENDKPLTPEEMKLVANYLYGDFQADIREMSSEVKALAEKQIELFSKVKVVNSSDPTIQKIDKIIAWYKKAGITLSPDVIYMYLSQDLIESSSEIKNLYQEYKNSLKAYLKDIKDAASKKEYLSKEEYFVLVGEKGTDEDRKVLLQKVKERILRGKQDQITHVIFQDFTPASAEMFMHGQKRYLQDTLFPGKYNTEDDLELKQLMFDRVNTTKMTYSQDFLRWFVEQSGKRDEFIQQINQLSSEQKLIFDAAGLNDLEPASSFYHENFEKMKAFIASTIVDIDESMVDKDSYTYIQSKLNAGISYINQNNRIKTDTANFFMSINPFKANLVENSLNKFLAESNKQEVLKDIIGTSDKNDPNVGLGLLLAIINVYKSNKDPVFNAQYGREILGFYNYFAKKIGPNYGLLESLRVEDLPDTEVIKKAIVALILDREKMELRKEINSQLKENIFVLANDKKPDEKYIRNIFSGINIGETVTDIGKLKQFVDMINQCIDPKLTINEKIMTLDQFYVELNKAAVEFYRLPLDKQNEIRVQLNWEPTFTNSNIISIRNMLLSADTKEMTAIAKNKRKNVLELYERLERDFGTLSVKEYEDLLGKIESEFKSYLRETTILAGNSDLLVGAKGFGRFNPLNWFSADHSNDSQKTTAEKIFMDTTAPYRAVWEMQKKYNIQIPMQIYLNLYPEIAEGLYYMMLSLKELDKAGAGKYALKSGSSYTQILMYRYLFPVWLKEGFAKIMTGDTIGGMCDLLVAVMIGKNTLNNTLNVSRISAGKLARTAARLGRPEIMKLLNEQVEIKINGEQTKLNKFLYWSFCKEQYKANSAAFDFMGKMLRSEQSLKDIFNVDVKTTPEQLKEVDESNANTFKKGYRKTAIVARPMIDTFAWSLSKFNKFISVPIGYIHSANLITSLKELAKKPFDSTFVANKHRVDMSIDLGDGKKVPFTFYSPLDLNNGFVFWNSKAKKIIQENVQAEVNKLNTVEEKIEYLQKITEGNYSPIVTEEVKVDYVYRGVDEKDLDNIEKERVLQKEMMEEVKEAYISADEMSKEIEKDGDKKIREEIKQNAEKYVNQLKESKNILDPQKRIGKQREIVKEMLKNYSKVMYVTQGHTNYAAQLSINYQVMDALLVDRSTDFVNLELVAGGGKTENGVIGLRMMADLMDAGLIDECKLAYIAPKASLSRQAKRDALELLDFLFSKKAPEKVVNTVDFLTRGKLTSRTKEIAGVIKDYAEYSKSAEEVNFNKRLTILSIDTAAFARLSDPEKIPSGLCIYWDEYDKYFTPDSNYVLSSGFTDYKLFQKVIMRKYNSEIKKGYAEKLKNGLIEEYKPKIQDHKSFITELDSWLNKENKLDVSLDEVINKFYGSSAIAPEQKEIVRKMLNAVQIARGQYGKKNQIFTDENIHFEKKPFQRKLDIKPLKGEVKVQALWKYTLAPGGEGSPGLRKDFAEWMLVRDALGLVGREIDDPDNPGKKKTMEKVVLEGQDFTRTLAEASAFDIMASERYGIGATGTYFSNRHNIEFGLDYIAKIKNKAMKIVNVKGSKSFPTIDKVAGDSIETFSDFAKAIKAVNDAYPDECREKKKIKIEISSRENQEMIEKLIEKNTSKLHGYDFSFVVNRPMDTYVNRDALLKSAADRAVEGGYDFKEKNGKVEISFKQQVLFAWDKMGLYDAKILRGKLIETVQDQLKSKGWKDGAKFKAGGLEFNSSKEFVEHFFREDIGATKATYELDDIVKAAAEEGKLTGLTWANRGLNIKWKSKQPVVIILGYVPREADYIQTSKRGDRAFTGVDCHYLVAAEDITAHLERADDFTPEKAKLKKELKQEWGKIKGDEKKIKKFINDHQIELRNIADKSSQSLLARSAENMLSSSLFSKYKATTPAIYHDITIKYYTEVLAEQFNRGHANEAFRHELKTIYLKKDQIEPMLKDLQKIEAADADEYKEKAKTLIELYLRKYKGQYSMSLNDEKMKRTYQNKEKRIKELQKEKEVNGKLTRRMSKENAELIANIEMARESLKFASPHKFDIPKEGEIDSAKNTKNKRVSQMEIGVQIRNEIEQQTKDYIEQRKLSKNTSIFIPEKDWIQVDKNKWTIPVYISSPTGKSANKELYTEMINYTVEIDPKRGKYKLTQSPVGGGILSDRNHAEEARQREKEMIEIEKQPNPTNEKVRTTAIIEKRVIEIDSRTTSAELYKDVSLVVDDYVQKHGQNMKPEQITYLKQVMFYQVCQEAGSKKDFTQTIDILNNKSGESLEFRNSRPVKLPPEEMIKLLSDGIVEGQNMAAKLIEQGKSPNEAVKIAQEDLKKHMSKENKELHSKAIGSFDAGAHMQSAFVIGVAFGLYEAVKAKGSLGEKAQIVLDSAVNASYMSVRDGFVEHLAQKFRGNWDYIDYKTNYTLKSFSQSYLTSGVSGLVAIAGVLDGFNVISKDQRLQKWAKSSNPYEREAFEYLRNVIAAKEGLANASFEAGTFLVGRYGKVFNLLVQRGASIGIVMAANKLMQIPVDNIIEKTVVYTEINVKNYDFALAKYAGQKTDQKTIELALKQFSESYKYGRLDSALLEQSVFDNLIAAGWLEKDGALSEKTVGLKESKGSQDNLIQELVSQCNISEDNAIKVCNQIISADECKKLEYKKPLTEEEIKANDRQFRRYIAAAEITHDATLNGLEYIGYKQVYKTVYKQIYKKLLAKNISKNIAEGISKEMTKKAWKKMLKEAAAKKMTSVSPAGGPLVALALLVDTAADIDRIIRDYSDDMTQQLDAYLQGGEAISTDKAVSVDRGSRNVVLQSFIVWRQQGYFSNKDVKAAIKNVSGLDSREFEEIWTKLSAADEAGVAKLLEGSFFSSWNVMFSRKTDGWYVSDPEFEFGNKNPVQKVFTLMVKNAYENEVSKQIKNNAEDPRIYKDNIKDQIFKKSYWSASAVDIEKLRREDISKYSKILLNYYLDFKKRTMNEKVYNKFYQDNGKFIETVLSGRGSFDLSKVVDKDLGKFKKYLNSAIDGWIAKEKNNQTLSDLHEFQRIVFELPDDILITPRSLAGMDAKYQAIMNSGSRYKGNIDKYFAKDKIDTSFKEDPRINIRKKLFNYYEQYLRKTLSPNEYAGYRQKNINWFNRYSTGTSAFDLSSIPENHFAEFKEYLIGQIDKDVTKEADVIKKNELVEFKNIVFILPNK